MASFRLQIVTAQKTVFDEQVEALTLPGEYPTSEEAAETSAKTSPSYFGILANHAPIVAVLQAGQVTIRRGGRDETVKITGGFIEMSNNEATLLVDAMEGLETVAPE
ncbi:MAG: F-type H+-transporting ATPase subunit epsilon [Candidatus Sumerlaeota bacterium]|nr:F-type H+-transporting ATPase subunit epsilon [Candidatus Sumerlaeota bacterium]